MPAGYVFADPTLEQIWNAFYGDLIAEAPWTLHLFVNDYTPTDNDSELQYDEAAFNGYAAIVLVMANWQVPTLAAHIAEIVYDPAPQFDFAPGVSDPVTIYGYYLMDSTATFRFAERVVTPKTIDQGEGLKVTPRLRLKTCR